MKITGLAATLLAFCGHAVFAASEPSVDANRAEAKKAHEQTLKAADSAKFQPTFLKADPLLSLYASTHSRYLLGNVSRMQTFDLDRDGQMEIITTATFQGDNRTAYSVLKAAPGSKDYQISHQSDELADVGEILLTYHLPESAEPVALIVSNSRLKLLSLESFQQRAVQDDVYWPQQAVLADVTGDGVAELVIRTGSEIRLLNPTSLEIEATVRAYSHVAMGNLDATPEPELLTVESRYVDGVYSNFLQIKGVSSTELTLKKEIPLSDYGWNTQLVDLDQDGILEIIRAASSGIEVLDAVSGAVRWADPAYAYYDFRPLGIVDIDNNGEPDIALIDRNNNRRIVFRKSSTGEQVHSIEVTQGQLLQFVAMSNDEALVLSNSNYYYGSQALNRISLKDGSKQWASTETRSSVNFIGLAKQHQKSSLLVSVSGRYDYVADSGIDIRVQLPADLAETAQLTLSVGNGQVMQFHSATIADTDGDGNDELLLVATRENNTVVYVVNLQTFASRWFIIQGYSYGRFAIAALDLEQDGKQEVVVASHAMLSLVDVEHGAILGQGFSDNFSTIDPTQVLIHDIDGDNVLDAFVGSGVNSSYGIQHYKLTAQPSFVRSITVPASVRSMALLDVEADGQRELLIGTDVGKLMQFDHVADQWSLVAAPCSGYLSAMKALTNEQLLMICGRQAAIYDSINRSARWVDSDLPTYIVNSNGIAFDDAPVNKTLFLAGGRLTRVAYLGHVRRPSAHPLQLRSHWRDVLNGSLLVTNPNPELNLSAKLLVNPAAGSATLAADGSLQFQYTPTGASLTNDEFRYSVTNGYLESEPAIVKIERTNNAPIAFPMTINAKAGKALNGVVGAKDIDADPLTWQVKTAPLHGELTLTTGTGEFSYTANEKADGDDSFVVTVSDGVSSTDVEVKLSITAKRSSSGGGSSTALMLVLMMLSIVVLRVKAASR